MKQSAKKTEKRRRRLYFVVYGGRSRDDDYAEDIYAYSRLEAIRVAKDNTPLGKSIIHFGRHTEF